MTTVAIVGVRKLGRIIALRYAKQGAHVVLVSRTASDLEAVAAEVEQAGGHAVVVRADITDRASLAPLATHPIDVCVAAQTAGGRFGAKPLLDIDDDELGRGLAVYVQGTWNLLKTVGSNMAERGSGTFVQIGTSSGVRTKEGFAALGAAQHGLRALVQVAAKELRKSGVHVAYVPIDGPIASAATEAWAAANGRTASLISPDEIARGVEYLAAQERSAWTHELLLRSPDGEWTAPT